MSSCLEVGMMGTNKYLKFQSNTLKYGVPFGYRKQLVWYKENFTKCDAGARVSIWKLSLLYKLKYCGCQLRFSFVFLNSWEKKSSFDTADSGSYSVLHRIFTGIFRCLHCSYPARQTLRCAVLCRRFYDRICCKMVLSLYTRLYSYTRILFLGVKSAKSK
jgi:hypothetical protein